MIQLDQLITSDALTNGKSFADILRDARLLLAEEHRWCDGAVCDDGHSVFVSPHSDKARRWSLTGAVCWACPHGLIPPKLIKFLDEFVVQFDSGHDVEYMTPIDHFNDNTTHDRLLAFLDEAIAYLS